MVTTADVGARDADLASWEVTWLAWGRKVPTLGPVHELDVARQDGRAHTAYAAIVGPNDSTAPASLSEPIALTNRAAEDHVPAQDTSTNRSGWSAKQDVTGYQFPAEPGGGYMGRCEG